MKSLSNSGRLFSFSAIACPVTWDSYYPHSLENNMKWLFENKMRDWNTVLQKTESVTWHSIPILTVLRMSVFHMPHSGKELFRYMLLWLYSVWLHLREFNFMQSFQIVLSSDRNKSRYHKAALRSSGKMKAIWAANTW